MTQTTFTFRVDDDLKIAFSEAAKAQDRSAAQLLRVLMREAVRKENAAREHEAWFRREVEQGLREADDSSIQRVPHEKVDESWKKQRAAVKKRISAKPA